MPGSASGDSMTGAMRIAIVHYHLGAGGVGAVIRSTSRALTRAGDSHVILCGDTGGMSPTNEEGLPVAVVKNLGYRDQAGNLAADVLLRELRDAAIGFLGAPPDVWHFHNHSLGKNPVVPDLVSLLASSGERMVLQIHDLAEEGRPVNCRAIAGKREIYPFSDLIHYLFLNKRDLETFLDAGLPPSNARVLPNPIDIEGLPAAHHDSERAPLLFAPNRGIRRKNLGEMVLLSALCPKGVRLATSMPPANPDALAVFDQWRRFSSAHGIPIEFGVVDRMAPEPGAAMDFQTWLSRATHILSTSVAEGFGLPFLEAMAWNRPVIGRKIAHLQEIHTGPGALYDAILVPLDWVEEKILRPHLEAALRRDFRLLGRQLSQKWLEEAYDSLVRDGRVDFGNLPEPLQQEIIERMADPHQRNVPVVVSNGIESPVVEWLREALKATGEETCLPETYSPRAVAGQLEELYLDLFGRSGSEVDHVDPSRILNAYATPRSFHFLQSALPPVAAKSRFRAVVLDIYGTLLAAASGGVKVDLSADPAIRRMIQHFGYVPPDSPTTELHAAVVRHHQKSRETYPEVDLRVLWREILNVPEGTDLSSMVTAIEDVWHPAKLMPGCREMVGRLSRQGVSLGLLSNAQCNTLFCLQDLAELFAPELRILSYQHGIAKPDERLFKMMADRLEGRGISPAEALYIGDHPAHDILPAAKAGFSTALLSASPAEECACLPDYRMRDWSEFEAIMWPRQ